MHVLSLLLVITLFLGFIGPDTKLFVHGIIDPDHNKISLSFLFHPMQVNSRSSREEILNLLAKRGDQVNRLEAKIAGAT